MFFSTGVLSKINDVSTYQNLDCSIYFWIAWNSIFRWNGSIFLSFLITTTYNSDIDSFRQVLTFLNFANIMSVKKRQQIRQHSRWQNFAKSLFLAFSRTWIYYKLIVQRHCTHFGHVWLKMYNLLDLFSCLSNFSSVSNYKVGAKRPIIFFPVLYFQDICHVLSF